MPKDEPTTRGLAQPEPTGPETDTLEPPTQVLDLTDLSFPLETGEESLERLSPSERIILDEIAGR